MLLVVYLDNHFSLAYPFLLLHYKGFQDCLTKNKIIKNNLSHEFKRYFQNMIYLEDNFFVDGTHLKKEKLDYFVKYYKNILTKEQMN